MINKSDVFTRRILTFPAIRPCESVSPVSLLASLINLGHTICEYKSKSFVTNKRKARELIRLVGNLLIFLEEIQNSRSKLLGATVLSLSELHFVFQKIQFLLEDCAREDARVWMLMKSGQVSDQFKVLTRAIGVAIDVMPLKSIHVSTEVKQLVDLVMRQALKANLRVESDDKWASDEVRLILNEFEDRIIPEPNKLRLFLEYLGIKRWSECSREIKFFEAEIELAHLTAEKRDLELLSSLVAFMSYCRCVVFDLVDSVSSQQSNTNTCSYLVPNLALKNCIKQYCLENGIMVAESGGRNRVTTKTIFSGSVAAEEAMKMLANFLVGKLVEATSREINKAAFEIRLLTKTSMFNRSCLIEAGVIPNLLNLLCSNDLLIQENAIASLLNLSKYSKIKRVLVEKGGLKMVLDVVKNGLKMEARQHAAGTLFYLASIEEYRVMIGEMPEAFSSLVELLKNGAERGKKNALVAIFGLIQCPKNHCRALAAGVVPLLINLLASSQREDLILDSLAVLATLAEKLDGAMAILSIGALHIIVRSLSSNSRTANEYCVSLLLALCINGGADVVLFLVKDPSLMGPLYSLLTEGTSRASKKASSLIRMLLEFSEKSSSGLRSPAVNQERFVHVW
ncbi:hypothetical protein LguiA_000256 [Lonicera macranthoides]